jgi:uncharacterized protein (TIGR02217 family)
MFNNVTIRRESGVRRTNEEWEAALRKWKIQFVVRWKAQGADGQPDPNHPSLAKFKELKEFWLCRRGNSRSFRFKDHTDYTDDGAGLVAEVDGVWRLTKKYDDGLDAYSINIYKPVEDTIALDTELEYSIDYETGIVTWAGTEAVAWTGEYDIWCHFVEPELQIQALPSGIIKWSGLTVLEDVPDLDVIVE